MHIHDCFENLNTEVYRDLLEAVDSEVINDSMDSEAFTFQSVNCTSKLGTFYVLLLIRHHINCRSVDKQSLVKTHEQKSPLFL